MTTPEEHSVTRIRTLSDRGVEERSLADIVQEPYVAAAVMGTGKYVSGKIIDAIRQPPGKHEKKE